MSNAPALPPYRPRPRGAATALAGVRVVDFTHFIAGPLATMILADMGADVIKIEKAAGGDDFRRFRPERGGIGAPFLWTNRNKRSVALDLTRPEAQAVARELIDTADIVVENFSGGVMKGFGLDYETLAASNPRLIYCAVSAYGREGELAGRLGFDPVVQAESGFMSLNGYPDGEPLRTGPAIMDMSTALMASNAILGALMARERLGRGQYVEVALFDTAMLMVGFHAMNHLVSGATPTRFGNTSPDSAPMGVFQAADGPIYLACANDRTFHRLARDVLGRPDLAEDPDFAESRNRVPNRERLADILNGLLAAERRDVWLEKMLAAGVPAGAVRTVSEAFASPEARMRGIVSEIPHPAAGTVPNIASPIRYSATPVVDPVGAPTLAQHTDEVLTTVLGYDRDKLDALTTAGAFGSTRNTG